MNTEKRNCQNCKKDFVIEPEDFCFYQKIKVPPPTFCPECRFQRRMAWRNERALYKRPCDLCQKDFISMYHQDSPFPIYCRECWYSDKWDATSYGRDYDFSKPFFEQWRELSKVVPRFGIFQRNAINSDYSNMVGECRNVYLSISVVLGSENVFYSWGVDKSFNIFDSYNVKESESCYENIECERNYNCQHLTLSHDCLDSFYLFDCVNCNNCAFSSNLRNKEFYFRNKKLSKEEYFKEIKKLNLKSRKFRAKHSIEFDQLCKDAIHRYANIYKSLNSTGNNIINAKNCRSSFEIFNTEDAKYCYRLLNNKDSIDIDYAGKAELMYEYNTGALNDYNVKFSYCAMDNAQNAEYTETCIVSQNLFGCISIKNKNNVILNKVYSQKEFLDLREKIIKQMNDMPYTDKKGRVYKYGEFFPIELSAFAYNESPANDFFHLSKEKIQENGYQWRESENKNYTISLRSEEIPDSIEEIDEKILAETIECLHQEKCEHHCTKAFRLTRDELSFYKKWQIPIPDKCYNCRHYERFNKVLLPKLWHRKCMHPGCNNEFETSYAPDRPEIVYCEKCYQNEVY